MKLTTEIPPELKPPLWLEQLLELDRKLSHATPFSVKLLMVAGVWTFFSVKGSPNLARPNDLIALVLLMGVALAFAWISFRRSLKRDRHMNPLHAGEEHLYERITTNRRNLWLVLLLLTLLLGWVGSWALGWVTLRAGGITLELGSLGGWLFGIVAAATIGFVSWIRGDHILLPSLDARPIGRTEAPVLFNVVEEMAIAGGIPIPKILLVRSSAPNVLSVVHGHTGSVIVVTSGLLEQLNRDELQATLAHEICHIRNGDALHGTMVAGMMHVIRGFAMVLSTPFRWLGYFFFCLWLLGSLRNILVEGVGKTLIELLSVLILFGIGYFFELITLVPARIIQFVMSREREFLADAGSVALAKNPLALATALEKLSLAPTESRLLLETIQHLWIVNPVRAPSEASVSLFDTHPPTAERVRYLRELAHETNQPGA